MVWHRFGFRSYGVSWLQHKNVVLGQTDSHEGFYLIQVYEPWIIFVAEY